MPRKPVIAMIGTGGSISTPGRHSLDLFEYSDYGPPVEVDELIARFPEIAAQADVRPARFRTIPGTAITAVDWLELLRLIHSLVDASEPVDGVVITHGTATIEETSYFLSLTLKTDVPVVLVGAQRPPNGLSSDAPLNMVNAVRLAASPQARGLGTLVLLNDEIHPAREVTKGSTYRVETMRCPDLGMLGYVDADGQVVIYRAPMRAHTTATEFDVAGRSDMPKVDIAYSYTGAGATVIEALVQAGAAAIVSAGQAPGKVTPAEQAALNAAAKQGILVVQSSRAGSGRVLERTRLREQGIVAADNLNPQKARILAMLALTVTRDFDRIQAMFRKY